VTRKMLQKVLQKNSLPYGEILLIIFNTFEFVTENVTCNKKSRKNVLQKIQAHTLTMLSHYLKK